MNNEDLEMYLDLGEYEFKDTFMGTTNYTDVVLPFVNF